MIYLPITETLTPSQQRVRLSQLRLRQSAGLNLTQQERIDWLLLEEAVNNPMMETLKASPDGSVVVARSYDVGSVFEGVKALSQGAKHTKKTAQYLGSIDTITAENWSKECGAKVGSKEFAAYAKKKLMSGDWAHFRADLPRTTFAMSGAKK